jgi:putative ABC transport system substrate-binding protein
MRLIGSVLALILTLVPLAGEGQQAPKIPKIGLLTLATPAAAAPLVEAFRQELRALGHVEGKPFVLRIRYGEAKTERLRELARDLAALKMDVIVAAQDQAIAAVKKETGTIPIVMSNSSDPVGTGFVASLAHPGGNITGLSNVSPELSGKRLELLRQVLSRALPGGIPLESRRQGQPARLQRNGGRSPFPACGASTR